MKGVKTQIFILMIVFLISTGLSMAGTIGKVVGKVVTNIEGVPVIGAQVSVVGTNFTTKVDPYTGEYLLTGIPPGKHRSASSPGPAPTTARTTELPTPHPIPATLATPLVSQTPHTYAGHNRTHGKPGRQTQRNPQTGSPGKELDHAPSTSPHTPGPSPHRSCYPPGMLG